MLKEYGSRINVVYCENDNMAYGVLEALENAGMKAGTDLSSGEVLVISFDAARQGLEKTLQGEIAPARQAVSGQRARRLSCRGRWCL